MCCESGERLDLPPRVIEMLAHYRRLLADQGFGWGEDGLPDMFRWARFSLLGPVFEAAQRTGDWPSAVREVVGAEPPAGVVVVRVDAAGAVRLLVGPARATIAGTPAAVDVVVDSAAGRPLAVRVAGEEVPVPAGGAGIATVDVAGPFEVEVDGHRHTVDGAVRTFPAATLRLSAPHCARWSVSDPSGGAWFPDGVPHKWDATHRPYFHARDVALAVPAGALAVSCGRGLEYERVEREVTAVAGATVEVACAPARLFDPAATGWYGGDLHVHLNYSGDLVCTPQDAARMQAGEGLHLANLVAGNFLGSRVYDRELLEESAGADLLVHIGPVARTGVEYRNDLLGHVHALGPQAPPATYHTGHEGSDQPYDWPPNKAACDELRALGATIGYAHPSQSTFPDGDLDAFFATARSVEARELVADAALGVVDSVDVLSPFDDEGAIYLYHRLLSCGLRLAATAGSDVFLSFRTAPTSRPTRRGGAGSTRSSVRRRCRWRRSRTRCAPGGRWSPTVRGSRSPSTARARAPCSTGLPAAGCGCGPPFRAWTRLTIVGPDGVLATGSGADVRSVVVDASDVDRRGRPRRGRIRSAPTTGCWRTRRRSTSTSTAGGWPGPPTPPGASGSSTGSKRTSPRTAASSRRSGTGSSATWSR